MRRADKPLEFPNLSLDWLFTGEGEMFINQEPSTVKETLREQEIMKGRLAGLEKKYDELKHIYKEQSEDLKKIVQVFEDMDIEGTITRFLKANGME